MKMFYCKIGDDFAISMPMDKLSLELLEMILPAIKKDVENHIKKLTAEEAK